MTESLEDDDSNSVDEVEFRFDNKKRYEDEIKKILLVMSDADVSRVKARSKFRKLEDSYEELVEEYVQFCSTKIDGE